MKEEILRMDRVTRIVDGVTRLDNFSLHIFRGEIVGLLSMNDQGRDDLVELLQQNLPLHYGFVYFGERLVNSYQKSPMTENRVSVIDRRRRLVDDLTVADNVFVLRRGFKKYLVEPRVLRGQLAQFVGELDLPISADEPVSELSGYERCAVEVLKAVIAGTRLIVVREISNVLSAADLERFQKLLRHYAGQGFSFLYICAHHEEAFPVCDRVAVMENGGIALNLNRPFQNDEAIWRRSLDFSRPAGPPRERADRQPVVRLDRVTCGAMRALSFSLWPGECLTILDRSNTILTDLMALMNRERPPASGTVQVGGAPLRPGRGREKPGQELGFIGEDPAHTMLFPELSALDNLCFLADRRDGRLWRSPALRRSIAREYERFLGGAVYERDVGALTHQQRYDLVYYRMHLYHPGAVFCMQPFLGADMYLRHHIIGLLEMLRGRGVATVLLSVNISDSLSVADRLLVVEQGRLVREYRREDFHTLSKQEGYDPHRTK